MVRIFGYGMKSPKGSNYPYVTARVRAKKAQLLSPDTYPKLLARDVHEIARTLQEGGYGAEIDHFAGKASGALLIERATRLNLGRTYAQILDMCEGELKVMVGLYLERYDVYNLKTILRGKFAGMTSENIITELVPTGSIPLARLEQLARQDTLLDVIQQLRDTPYGRGIQTALGETAGQPPASLVEVENAIDRTFYEHIAAGFRASDKSTRAFLAFLQREVDVQNLRTLLRLKEAGIADYEPYFIDGGASLTREKAGRIMRATRDEFAAEIAKLKFGPRLEEGVRAYLDGSGLNPLITALDKALIESADDFGHVAPLSVLPVIDYILRKKVEVDNLRIIAHGKESGLPDEVIEGLLIL